MLRALLKHVLFRCLPAYFAMVLLRAIANAWLASRRMVRHADVFLPACCAVDGLSAIWLCCPFYVCRAAALFVRSAACIVRHACLCHCRPLGPCVHLLDLSFGRVGQRLAWVGSCERKFCAAGGGDIRHSSAQCFDCTWRHCACRCHLWRPHTLSAALGTVAMPAAEADLSDVQSVHGSCNHSAQRCVSRQRPPFCFVLCGKSVLGHSRPAPSMRPIRSLHGSPPSKGAALYSSSDLMSVPCICRSSAVSGQSRRRGIPRPSRPGCGLVLGSGKRFACWLRA